MSLYLPSLYHWSPAENRVEIIRDGLKPYSPALTHEGYAYPYVCLGTSPSSAWGLSGDMDGEIEDWDLFQVTLIETDDTYVRNDFGNIIREVRVRNPVPGDRLWWVATRSGPVAVETKPARRKPTRKR